MIIDTHDLVPLATILGGLLAPTLASIWAGNRANKNAVVAAQHVVEVKEALTTVGKQTNTKLDIIHILVNNQLSEAVGRLNDATLTIAELKRLLEERSDK